MVLGHAFTRYLTVCIFVDVQSNHKFIIKTKNVKSSQFAISQLVEYTWGIGEETNLFIQKVEIQFSQSVYYCVYDREQIIRTRLKN